MKRRSDAVENRAVLIEAARRVFATHGVTAPLDLVVREAGLGRGTLYRNFPDREALIAAILDDRIGGLEHAVSGKPLDGRLERVLLRYCDYLLDTPGLVAMMRTSPGGPVYFERMQARLSRLLEEVIGAAKSRGDVRADLVVEDVILVLAMMEGAVANLGAAMTPQLARRSAALLVRTLRDPRHLDRDLPQQ